MSEEKNILDVMKEEYNYGPRAPDAHDKCRTCARYNVHMYLPDGYKFVCDEHSVVPSADYGCCSWKSKRNGRGDTLMLYAEGYTYNDDGEPVLDKRYYAFGDFSPEDYDLLLMLCTAQLESTKDGMVEIRLVSKNILLDMVDWDHEVLLDVLKWENGRVVAERTHNKMR